MKSPSVSIVVLSYNRPALLVQALASIEKQTYPAELFEIVVVDNRSEASDDVAAIVARHPRARLVANAENLGFTGGMNVGLAHAHGELIYLTEDDIVLAPENLSALVAYAEAHPDFGIAAGLMHRIEDGAIWCAGGDIQLSPRFVLKVRGQGEANKGQYTQPFEVSYIPGATMFARADFWAALRGFRNDFFMYYEDIELCLRVRRMGRSLVIVPAAHSFHFTPEPRPAPPYIEFHKRKNLTALHVLHAPVGALSRYLLRQPTDFLRGGANPLAVSAYGDILRRFPALLRDRLRIRMSGV